MQRLTYFLFVLLHALLYMFTLMLEASLFLCIGNPYKFPYTWVDFIPLTVFLLTNFALLFFTTIKNKLNKLRINIILILDVLLKLPYLGIFLFLIFDYGLSKEEFPLLYFTIAMSVLNLSGAITAKILQNYKDNKS